MRVLLVPLLLSCLLLGAGCDLCWPRGGSLGRCLEVVDDDDDSGDDDDTAPDDDDTGDDDDSTADDDDATDPPPCEQGDLIPGPPFTVDIGAGPTLVNYDFVCIEGASFRMGFELEEPGYLVDEAAHDVTLTRTYAIGVWEVPQAFYAQVWGSDPSQCDDPKGCTDLTPVNSVSWSRALEFANQLSADEGLDPVYNELAGIWMQNLDANGYRLPTEAEWEYAAQGGEDYEFSGSDDVGDVAWCDAFTDVFAKPVGLKEPNGYGLYDMSGNVTEHCWDGYEPYDLTPQVDPTGPLDPFYRVRRGGTYDYQCELTRVNDRSWDTVPGSYNKGFRLARTMWVPTE
ncbi:MAG: SUMF1/EgtB/PvdO family nonheme iron enzyme [Deltaproteobacteria bacterium]|nr:SUMF1/EgtB/PvdO family nonheme iron enzyme [Deltaproteobacteria bacterium]